MSQDLWNLQHLSRGTIDAPARLRVTLLAAAALLPLTCAAQASPAGTAPPTPSKADIFATYSYLHPFESHLYGQPYTSIPGGASGGFTAYFLPWLGLDAEYAKLFDNPDYCFSTIQGGLALRYPHGRLVPFAHAIGGAAQTGPAYDHSGSTNICSWGWASTAASASTTSCPPSTTASPSVSLRSTSSTRTLTSARRSPPAPTSAASGRSKPCAPRPASSFASVSPRPRCPPPTAARCSPSPSIPETPSPSPARPSTSKRTSTCCPPTPGTPPAGASRGRPTPPTPPSPPPASPRETTPSAAR